MKLKIGDFLKRRKDAIDVTDGVKYKRKLEDLARTEETQIQISWV